MLSRECYCKSSYELFENAHSFLLGNAAALLDLSVEVASVAVLQRKYDVLLILVGVVAAHDVVAVELQHDLYLALEELFADGTHPLRPLLLDLVLADKFEGYHPFRVLHGDSLVDLAEGPLAELANAEVITDPVTDRSGSLGEV